MLPRHHRKKAAGSRAEPRAHIARSSRLKARVSGLLPINRHASLRNERDARASTRRTESRSRARSEKSAALYEIRDPSTYELSSTPLRPTGCLHGMPCYKPVSLQNASGFNKWRRTDRGEALHAVPAVSVRVRVR